MTSTDQSNRNIETVQSIYAAFGRGDVAAILERCDADVCFGFEGGSPAVSWHGPWRGRDQVASFFGTISQAVAFEAFEPRDFAVSASGVAVPVRVRYRVLSTGRVVDQLQVHWWTFRDGRVVELRHHEDTAQVRAAV